MPVTRAKVKYLELERVPVYYGIEPCALCIMSPNRERNLPCKPGMDPESPLACTTTTYWRMKE